MSGDPIAIILRAVEPRDEPFLFEVYASTRAEEMAAWGWNEAQQEPFLRMQFNIQRRAYQMQYEEADHCVILYNSDPAGRLLVSRTAREIQLVDISILPEFRNKRIGTTLIKELCVEAARKAVPLRLQVLRSNGAAARLYSRLGFSKVGETGVYLEMEWLAVKP